MELRHTVHSLIDKTRWDCAVERSFNPRVYALSWYLDAVSPGWEGLISDDYEMLFPLPVKRRLGFRYVVQPTPCQQLGLIAPVPVSESDIAAVLAAIPYRYVRLHLWGGYVPGAVRRVNAVLSLDKPYEELLRGYSENCRRNLRRASERLVVVEESVATDWFADAFFRYNSHTDGCLRVVVKRLIAAATRRSVARVLTVRLPDGELLAGACLFLFGGRIYYLFPFSTPVGRGCSAMFMLIDSLVCRYALSSWVIDFEGSSLSSVMRFYRGFGAEEEFYCCYGSWLFGF